MKQRFIRGTNEKYSIREDGAVIRHYKTKPSIIIKLHNHCCNINISNKKRCLSSNVLLLKYFGYLFCVQCKNKIYYKSNIIRSNKLCNNCEKTNQLASTKKWLNNNPGKRNEYMKNWAKRYPEKFKANNNKKRKRQRKNINKSYAAASLNLKVNELSDDLYELFKAQLLVKRKLVEKTGLPIQNFK